MLEYALLSDVYKVDTLPSGKTKHKTARKSGERQQDEMSQRRLESSPQPQPLAVPVSDERYETLDHLRPYEGPAYVEAKGRYPTRFVERRPVVYETFADPDPYDGWDFDSYASDHECRCRICNGRMRSRRRRRSAPYDLEGLMRNVLFSFAIGAFAVYLIDILRTRR